MYTLPPIHIPTFMYLTEKVYRSSQGFVLVNIQTDGRTSGHTYNRQADKQNAKL